MWFIIQGKQHKPKWKAIAAQLLKAEGGVLKLKKLQSRALKAAQLADNPSKAALKAEMLAKVCSPPKCHSTVACNSCSSRAHQLRIILLSPNEVLCHCCSGRRARGLQWPMTKCG
jgi:hypothetical protein